MRDRTASLTLLLTTGAALVAPALATGAVAPGQNGRIAYVARPTGPPAAGSVRTMLPDGAGKRTERAGGVYSYDTPAWAPDGRRIAFARRNLAASADAVAVFDTASGIEAVVDVQALAPVHPSWSAVGDRVAYRAARLTSGWVCPNGGSVNGCSFVTPVIASRPASGGAERIEDPFGALNPDWAPNADRFVGEDEFFLGAGQLSLLEAPAATRAPTGFSGTHAAWSPNGRRIAYERGGDIWTAPVDVPGPEEQLTTGRALDASPAWSPDGTKLVFSRRRYVRVPGSRFFRYTDADIYVMNADGTGLANLTNTPATDETEPDWGTGVDRTPPTVHFVSPRPGNGGSVGQALVIQYTCDDEPGGSGLASCEGDLPNGDTVTHNSPGPWTFTVTARDLAGNQRTSTITVNTTFRLPPREPLRPPGP